MGFGAIAKNFSSKPAIASYGNRFIGGNIPLSPGGSAAPASFGNMPNINSLAGVTQAPNRGGFAIQRGGGNPVSAGITPYRPQAPQQQQSQFQTSTTAAAPPSAQIYSQPQQQHALNAIRAQAAQQANPAWQNKIDQRPGVSRDLSQPVTSQGIGRIAGINAQGMEDSAMQDLQMRLANQQYQLQSNQLFAGDQLVVAGAGIDRQALFANDDLMRKQFALQSMGF